MGDPNGVGPEIIVRTFEDRRMFDFFTIVVFGSLKVLNRIQQLCKTTTKIRLVEEDNKLYKNSINVIDVTGGTEFSLNLGQPSKQAGSIAYLSLVDAAEKLLYKHLQVLVTAPIDKQTIQSENFRFRGHTEYLSDLFEQQTMMMMVSENLKVALVTEHESLKDVVDLVTDDVIDQKLTILIDSLRRDFNIAKPKVAVLGLNPHAGDHGVLGHEEQNIIHPVILDHRERGNLVFGTFPADGFFGKSHYLDYDAVLAMYHDQGLIPFKTITFGEGVNFTSGLEGVRTSPDHGTAYDIAGKKSASLSSFRNALFTARDIYHNRKVHQSTMSPSHKLD